MTAEGVEKLVSYQRAYYPRDWKFTTTQNEIDEMRVAYMEALAGYENEEVLMGYLANLKGWEKMPTIAQIMTAADGRQYVMQTAAGRDGFRCQVCRKPWGRGQGEGREEPRRRGEPAKVVRWNASEGRGDLISRCPNCNARLDRPVPAWVFIDGLELADDVNF